MLVAMLTLIGTVPFLTTTPAGAAAIRIIIVVMHFGTNDVWSNIAPATILSALTTLVNQMRASNPATRRCPTAGTRRWRTS
ncbi:hypothetical protein [Nonomuraea sp. NPDC049129]|uniref:hypothetical protein n=1 Tax=unclassified Nonomuraea TaxID=2593643 RepID=UPI00340233EC